ncbi:MAG: NPCBM/NEW2 domain-containing protein, partial [Culicoidibacterales bacterium]
KLTAAQAVGDESVLDLLEVESDRILISSLASAGYQSFVNEGQSPASLVENINTTFTKLLEFEGLDGSRPEHDPKALKEHVRVMQPYGFLYAYTTHVGIQRGHATAVLREGFLNSWGMAHETGHRFDNKFRTWGEVTNNMQSMYASSLTGKLNDRIKYEEVYQKVAEIETDTAISQGGYFVSLAAFWQLQVADENYWPELNKLYRERRPSFTAEKTKDDYMIEYSSEVLGVNLTEHFARHGLHANEATAQTLAATYPAAEKYWYLNTKAWEYEGTGLAAQVDAKITAISNTGLLTIASDIPEADLLGYEIVRDGEVIGFTRTNTFQDQAYQSETNVNYAVVPYGANGKAGEMSPVYASHTPTITVNQPNVMIPLYTTFEPLDYITAKNYQGESLQDALIIKSTVDTTKKGTYTVTYTVEDQGIEVQTQISVRVIAEAVHVSDLTWKTATQSYKSVVKDRNLSGTDLTLLNQNGDVVSYEKGLGTHARAEIVYDLTDSDYLQFESAIGIDQSMATRPGSVVFQVYLDGTKAYDSGKM